MAKIKKLSINQILTRMSIIIEGQTADVLLPPLMAIVGRMVTECSKDPRLAQYMYRHLSMAKSNLEVLTVAGAIESTSTGALGTSESEEPALDESFKLVNEMPMVSASSRPEFPKSVLVEESSLPGTSGV